MGSVSDVDEDVFTQSPVVDIEVLEAAKENIQPLASGRRVTTLSAILSTPHAQREAQLLSARKRHRLNVEIALQDEDDDPLEAYVRFVNWILDNYPQGQSSESGLLELLEEATRVLKDDRGGIWKAELKYLKLWLLYASFVEKPTLIFKFLLANDIGTNHAILYEEYASTLERSGWYDLYSCSMRPKLSFTTVGARQTLRSCSASRDRRSPSSIYKPGMQSFKNG